MTSHPFYIGAKVYHVSLSKIPGIVRNIDTAQWAIRVYWPADAHGPGIKEVLTWHKPDYLRLAETGLDLMLDLI